MRAFGLAAACLSLSVGVCACEDEPVAAPQKAPSGTPKAAKAPPKAAGLERAQQPAENPPPVVFNDSDFVESERSRDPFRSFARFFVKSATQGKRSQRNVVLDEYSLDELRLIGIVTKIRPERAMLVDPQGKGHVITRGQFIGRAEVVQGGTNNTQYEVNWRVERIRPSDIVLVREDPTNPNVPTATRVIPLRPEEALPGL